MSGIINQTGDLARLYKKHAQVVAETLKEYKDALIIYIDQGNTQEVKDISEKVHNLESEADELRRRIIRLLIEKRYLVPNTRRDFIHLLKLTDKAADKAESTLDFIILESMNVSPEGRKMIENILDLTITQFDKLVTALDYVFTDIHQAFTYVYQICDLESEIDQIESNLINLLAEREDISFGLKVLYRDFLSMITNVSDIIEDAADQIELIVALRKV
ncbi:MAG: DUF47 domain-containing protein [Bacillota bacterium]